MRFACLGSGSEGNALLVQSANTTLLVDCGFGLNETEARLARLGVALADLTGVLVTHEHGDHVGGVARLANRLNLAVWSTYGTWISSPLADLPSTLVRLIDAHSTFVIDGIQIDPFPVPHDAREPVQFVFSDGDARLGLLTDTGSVTPHIEHMLSGCNALVLESNHDARILQDGPYPPALKTRIASRVGHLDNATAAALLARVRSDKLHCVVAAHLSDTNNLPELVLESFSAALGCEKGWIAIADQREGLAWRDVG